MMPRVMSPKITGNTLVIICICAFGAATLMPRRRSKKRGCSPVHSPSYSAWACLLPCAPRLHGLQAIGMASFARCSLHMRLPSDGVIRG